jgi:hypothetical protein
VRPSRRRLAREEGTDADQSIRRGPPGLRWRLMPGSNSWGFGVFFVIAPRTTH